MRRIMFPLRQARPESIIIPTLLLTGSAGGEAKIISQWTTQRGWLGMKEGEILILSSLPFPLFLHCVLICYTSPPHHTPSIWPLPF